VTAPLTLQHAHVPVFRVVKAGWQNPLDTTHGKLRGGRWNPKNTFGVLHTACSERVARAITLDLFRFAAVELDDLMPAVRPALAEISWQGTTIDVVTDAGVSGAGFIAAYPDGVGHQITQPVGVNWHQDGREAVVCRSASLSRLGFRTWSGSHEPWGELAIFVENVDAAPFLLQMRSNLDWLTK
jgi:hypothetical protein